MIKLEVSLDDDSTLRIEEMITESCLASFLAKYDAVIKSEIRKACKDNMEMILDRCSGAFEEYLKDYARMYIAKRLK